MKKNLFTTGCLIAGAAVVFASCSNDDVVSVGTGDEPLQVITMSVANSGDNFLRTRGTEDRTLYSSEAKQSIENVKVVIYKLSETVEDINDPELLTRQYGDRQIVAEKLFTDWMNGGVSSSYSDAVQGHGRQASWTLKNDDVIKQQGVYMAYAIGYNTENYANAKDFGSWTKSDLENPADTKRFPVSVQSAGAVKEIFAGSTLFVVQNKKNTTITDPEQPDAWEFNASLTLHRQVAGTIGYFTNIPLMGNKDHSGETGAVLRLVASARNTNAVFAGFNSDFKGYPATDDTDAVKYVVNGYGMGAPDARFYGSSSDDAYEVYSINLKSWFADMDKNGDGFLNSADTWQNAIYPANDGQGATKLLKGSVLGSSFLFPFQRIADKATFQLQLLNANGVIIRYWNIRLPNSSTPGSQFGKLVTIVDKDGVATTSASEADKENAVNYSIVRNHLYNIGTRDMGDNPDKDPVDPTDPEKPQDLNNETLILKVNDNWEMIHQLEVD